MHSSTIHRIANASAGTIVDRFGNFLARTGKACKIVIEGADITHQCFHAIETADGMLTAKCYKMRDGGMYVLASDQQSVETITRVGRGHIFFPGCCSRAANPFRSLQCA